MKNRSQPFECSIAAKTVGVSLRHGGGLFEPDAVYVRCDERDCQYVDLNQPPCPLRVEMFADGSHRRVAEYLAARPGERFCYACLMQMLEITHDQVRRASWQLKEAASVSIRPSRCAECKRRRITIGGTRDGVLAEAPAAAKPAPTAIPGRDELATFLRAQAGYAFCAHCLARELKQRPAEIREVMWSLEDDGAFLIRTTQCVSCLLSKPVIRYQEPTSDLEVPRRVIHFLVQSPDLGFCQTCVAFSTDLALGEVRRIFQQLDAVPEFESREAECSACGRWQPIVLVHGKDSDPDRVAAVGDVLTGRVRHRGHRIDLLSFRTAEGWRPFALVKSALGALVPDAPPILLGTIPTKVEADELAAVQAREWIDKRFP